MLPPEERLPLLMTLVKRSHVTARELLGESLTTDETEFLEKWRVVWADGIRTYHKAVHYPALMQENAPSVVSVRKTVFADVADCFGTKPAYKHSDEWSWVKTYDRWLILTSVVIDKSYGAIRMRYSHTVRLSEGGRRTLDDPDFWTGSDRLGQDRQDYTDYCRWMGLGRIEWETLPQKDIAEASLLLVDFIRLFFAGAPEFLIDG